MSKFIGIIVGAVAIAAAFLIPGLQATLPALFNFLLSAGAGLVLSGVGTLIAGSGQHIGSVTGGLSVMTRNPVAPRNMIYGRAKVGGAMVYLHEFGDANKYLDIVAVLADHPCEAVEWLMFDNQKIQIDGTGTSFTPVQQTISISTITRNKGVVTVVLNENIPYLSEGDDVFIQNVTGDYTLNGRVAVAEIVSRTTSGAGTITFTYLSGGTDDTFSGQGEVKTAWADYGRKVYMEALLGTHTATFTGMLSGTPDEGDTGTLIQDGSNPWTAAHKLLGTTCVFVRLKYDAKVFSGGIPQISFIVRGKNDILDPRTSATGYTENAALCTADYLHHDKYGFRAAYTTEIPDAELIAAANICDEDVTLASGATEKRYTLNGAFPVTVRRGEVLQNMLTACGGRISYTGGQWIIYPAAWRGSSPTVLSGLDDLAGAFQWKPTVSAREWFNAVKGTYISPANRWQAADFPPYAQDVAHGYESDAMLAADGERRWLDIQLPFTISPATAQRLAKIELLRRRHAGTGTFVLNMTGYTMAPMDVLAITNSYLGWTGKQVEILAHRFKIERQTLDGGVEAVAMGVEIDVQETAASIFDWEDTEEIPPEGYRQTTMPGIGGAGDVTGATIADMPAYFQEQWPREVA